MESRKKTQLEIVSKILDQPGWNYFNKLLDLALVVV